MRIFVLSWEYPPRIVGGLSRHVHDLSHALVQMGHQVCVFTCHTDGAPDIENDQGIMVKRVHPSGPAPKDFIIWAMQLNFGLLGSATREIEDGEPPDLIHAHDWLVAYAAATLKHTYKIPLVATIHATEWGRNHGLYNDLQRHISDVEWWLCFEAWRVICCSEYMSGELKWVFQVPDDKIRVIPNGIDPAQFMSLSREGLTGFRARFAAPDERLIFFIGRLVHEKGAHVLVDAVPKILHYWDKAKVVIAGRGPQDAYLKDRARELGVASRIYFTGFIDDETRNRLYSCADVAVFPSLYEPFGITALEAMAAGVPVVVSDVGGLGEVVRHGLTGWKAYPGDSNSLADGILRLLHEPHLAHKLRDNAFKIVRSRYNWQVVAEDTLRVYDEVLSEYQESDWAGHVDREARILAGRNNGWRQRHEASSPYV